MFDFTSLTHYIERQFSLSFIPGHGYVLWLLRILDEDGSLAADFLDRSSGKKDAAVCKERALRHLNIPGWEDLRGAIEATDPELIYERRSMDRAPLDKWSDCNGHAVLVGDGMLIFVDTYQPCLQSV